VELLLITEVSNIGRKYVKTLMELCSSLSRYRMNTKIVTLVVLVTALVAAICSASRSSDEDMPYRQRLRELRKKGTDLRRRFNEV